MTTSSAQLRQIALAMGLALAAAGCSTISDLDPTGLLSDSSSSDNAPASQFPDQAAPTASDQDVGTTPDLASLPARPAPSATPGDQQQTAQSLASDGAQARYSADALRGGTEAAAPPPTASDAAPTIAQRVLGADETPPTAAAPPTAASAPPTASDAPPTAEPAPQIATAAPPPQAPAAAEPTPQMPAGAQPAVPAAAPVQTAALPAPGPVAATPVGPSASVPAAAPVAAAPVAAPSGEPAVPANTPMRGAAMMAPSAASDAALGFKPSAAPPLDPSVGQFVSAPIIARYRQTASNTVPVSTAAVPAVAPKGGAAASDDGSVVANLDAAASGRIAMMNGGVPATAVIYFPGDGIKLTKAAHARIRAAVAAFKAQGGRGTVRVVGHASSRTANMSVERHMETIFAKSQARASAVAQDLIHQGIPADKVMIDAVGDSQPIYFESMPKGEEGNRRAEIFVQG